VAGSPVDGSLPWSSACRNDGTKWRRCTSLKLVCTLDVKDRLYGSVAKQWDVQVQGYAQAKQELHASRTIIEFLLNGDGGSCPARRGVDDGRDWEKPLGHACRSHDDQEAVSDDELEGKIFGTTEGLTTFVGPMLLNALSACDGEPREVA
jgi:hypothetical protein